MKKLAMLFAVYLGATVHVQAQIPQLWFHAAQCLAVKNFLPSTKAIKLSFGFLLDDKSYPGDKAIYVVNYAAPTRSNGLVFTIFLTEHDGRQDFNIPNNASFVLSRDEFEAVSFVNPPLGGAWTQEHLAAAIKRIEKQPRFTLSAEDLRAADSSIRCGAYTDLQPRSR